MFEREAWLVRPFIERGKVVGILGQTESNSSVHDRGQTLISRDGFCPQRGVEVRLEVNGGTP